MDASIDLIRAAPDSDAPRLAFADKCASSDPARSELIRLQCDLASASANPIDRKLDQQRVQALLDEHSARWVGPDAAQVRYPTFTRGFIEEVEFSPDTDPLVLKRLLDKHPIRILAFADDAFLDDQDDVLFDVMGKQLETWAAAPVLGRMATLQSDESQLGEIGWRILLASPHNAELRAINLSDEDSNPRVAASIAETAGVGLRRISFRGYITASLGDDGVRSLTRSARLTGLRELDLWNCSCESGAAEAIAESPFLHQLERLHFGGGNYTRNRIGRSGGQALADAPKLTQLRHLNLDFNTLTDAGASALIESAGMPALEQLSLQANELSNATLRCFMSAHQRFPRLRLIDLSHNDVDEQGIDSLVTYKFMEQIEVLWLYHNKVGPNGVYALCDSPKSSTLTTLNLTQNPLGSDSARVVEALIQSPSLQGLQELRIERCGLAEEDRLRLRAHFGARVIC